MMVIVLWVVNENVEGLFNLFILEFYSSIGCRGESYEFSKVDLEFLIVLRSLFGLEN